MPRTWTMTASEVAERVKDLIAEENRRIKAVREGDLGVQQNPIEAALDAAGPFMQDEDDWLALALLCLDQAGCGEREANQALEMAMGER